MKTTAFKNTDIGPIPEDWEVKKLGDCSSIARGGSPRPIENFLTDSPDGVNWIKIGDVQTGAKHINSTEEKITRDGIAHSRLVHPGDFLLSNSMSFGRPYIVNTDGCIHDGWLVVQNYGNQFDTDFLFYLLGSQTVLCQYQTLAAGSSVLNLNKGLVADVAIPTPPLPEQRRIAAALSDADELVASLDKLIEKKKRVKEGAMQRLLSGETRLPGFGDKKYKQTDLGSIPADWDVKRIGEIGTEFSYGVGAEAIAFDGHTKYIRITDINDESHLFTPNPLTSPAHYSGAHMVHENDLLIARTGASVGKSYIYEAMDGQLVFAGFLMKASITRACAKFVFYHTLSDRYKHWVREESARSGQPGLNLEQLKCFLFPAPALPEQRAIAAVLSDMDAEIAALSRERAEAERIKQGMMQELLTGKTRLTEGE